MRLSGRLFLVVGLATGTAVVTLFACGVDQEQHLPGLPDALPNSPGGAGFAASGVDGGSGAGGAGSGSGSGSGSGVGGFGGGSTTGTAQSLCDVVAGANVVTSACATCVNNTATGACMAQDMACTSNALCGGAEQLCANCGQNDTCIESCLGTSSLYQQLITCELQQCAPLCGHSPPLACAITDGG